MMKLGPIKKKKKSKRFCWSNWLFLAPCLIVIMLCAGWPLLRTVFFSFTDATLDNLRQTNFVGMDNFIALAKDGDWWRAVQNTFLIALISVPLETILGMIVALILHRNFRGRGWMRAIVLIPWTIPTIVSARMWAWMLNDVYGIVNELLMKFSIIDAPIPWIASNSLSVVSIILVDVWKTTPYMALLLLAGLQSLPRDCFEAAEVDSIPFSKTLVKIILPLMKPTIIVAMIFRTLDALRIFDLVYVLSNGNSANATMSVYARKHLVDYADVGYGSAAATTLLFFVLFLGIIYVMLNRKKMQDLD
ncbi:MAG: sugar ABC transporter permease [Holosporaceae bacterium]|jgi:trehalose/maltose transport system permease protein|nr:sugar ABC transporter permease [Holosporaceae bacterium]